jgi:hypothetical protein
MADVYMQAKKHNSRSFFGWFLLTFLVLAAFLFYLLGRSKNTDTVTPPATTTGVVQYFAEHIGNMHQAGKVGTLQPC